MGGPNLDRIAAHFRADWEEHSRGLFLYPEPGTWRAQTETMHRQFRREIVDY